MSPPRVAILAPYYKWVEGPTSMCLLGLGLASGGKVAAAPINTNGCYVEESRNGLTEAALECDKVLIEETGAGFDYALWIDADMIFPADSLLRLIAHDKDVVGANYRQRHPPYAFCGQYKAGGDTNLMAPGLHEMAWMPFGLILVRFEIMRRMTYPWFKAANRGEARDDVFFCYRAAEMGYSIWCDHDLTKEVQHITDQKIPWFEPSQLRVDPVVGAGINNERSRDTTAERVREDMRKEIHKAA